MSKDFYPSRNIFTKKIVLITGVHGTGKSMLSPIVSSLERCENLRKDFSIEHIQILFHYGKISKDAAKYMLGSKVDFMFYDSLIGRNINMRFGDESSLWNSSDPVNLFSRLASSKGSSVIDEHTEKNDTIFLLDTHNSVWHSQLWFDCFPNIKIINIQRHPIDVVNSWYKNGLGNDIWNNKINQLLTLKWENGSVPYYAYGWEDRYVKSSPIERVILMYNHVINKHYESMLNISNINKEKIFDVHFDKIALKPSENIRAICDFLQTNETIQTPINKEQEYVPRELHPSERDKKFNNIKKIADDEFIEIISAQSISYESKYSTLEL
jgi:hypothetical protein